jgi:hypothetical protein
MTYQNSTATHSFADGVHRALNSVGSYVRMIGLAMMENSTANQRLKHIHMLQAKTDDELAELKIKRDDIVHEVFKDLYYA